MRVLNVDSFHASKRGYRKETEYLAACGIALDLRTLVGEDALIQGAQDADVLLVEHPDTPLTARVLRALPRCRLIVKCAVGIDNIDVEAANEVGIVVSHVPNYCVEEVSDHAAALILACARRLFHFDRHVRTAGWNDIRFEPPIRRITTQRLGLIGFGRIARRLAEKLRPWKMEMMAYDPHAPQEAFLESGVRSVPLAELLAASNFVSLHLPLTPGTHHMIGKKELNLMRRDAFLINTSRGRIVDETALLETLISGSIAGAALDVTADEPPRATSPLRVLPNILLTPHFGASSVDAVDDLRSITLHSIAAFADGFCPPFVINPSASAAQRLRPFEQWKQKGSDINSSLPLSHN